MFLLIFKATQCSRGHSTRWASWGGTICPDLRQPAWPLAPPTRALAPPTRGPGSALQLCKSVFSKTDVFRVGRHRPRLRLLT